MHFFTRLMNHESFLRARGTDFFLDLAQAFALVLAQLPLPRPSPYLQPLPSFRKLSSARDGSLSRPALPPERSVVFPAAPWTPLMREPRPSSTSPSFLPTPQGEKELLA